MKEEARRHTETIEDYEHILKAFSGNWQDIYQSLDAEHKNAFWKKVLKEIVLNKTTHKVDHVCFLPCGCSK